MLPPPPPQVMNASPTDQAIARSTGVFWRNEFDGFRGTTDMVQRGDGLQFTFLLAENINSGFWADITPARRDLQTGYIAVGLSVVYVSQDFRFPDQTKPTGMFGTVYNSKNFLVPQPGYALTDGPGHNDATINSNLTGAISGQSPRPSSNHPGIALFCFADGHALPLSQNIDMLVYVRAFSARLVLGPADRRRRQVTALCLARHKVASSFALGVRGGPRLRGGNRPVRRHQDSLSSMRLGWKDLLTERDGGHSLESPRSWILRRTRYGSAAFSGDSAPMGGLD